MKKIINKNILIFTCHSGGGDEKCVGNFMKRLGADNKIISKIDFIDPLKSDLDEVKKTLNNWMEGLKRNYL